MQEWTELLKQQQESSSVRALTTVLFAQEGPDRKGGYDFLIHQMRVLNFVSGEQAVKARWTAFKEECELHQNKQLQMEQKAQQQAAQQEPLAAEQNEKSCMLE